MLISQPIPNLINGVSQQAAPLRLPGQCEEQVNAVASIVEGLKKRPPTQHIKRLTTSTWNNPKVHPINRDASERYIVVIINGDLFVYDLAGTAKTVTYPDGKAYLGVTGKPYEQFRCQTVADTTFIVNREKVTALSSSTTTAAVHQALLWVKNAAGDQTYKVMVNGVEQASFTSGSTNPSATAAAADLAADLVANLGVSWTIVTQGPLISVKKNDGSDFTITTFDSYSNQGLACIKEKTQRYSDLPAWGIDGMIVHVLQDPTNGNDDYWVKFTADVPGDLGRGSWSETIAPSVKFTYDYTTMPFVLVRNADGTFTFKKGTWTNRLVGDDTSVPIPSFIGDSINDVFLFRGRLGVLSSENVVLSEAGNDLNFWRTTATTLLDGDPIDVQNSSAAVSTFYSAVPFHDKLLLFSDTSQHTLSDGGNSLLTTKTVSITLSTQFESLTVPRPINVGSSIFFPYPRGDFSGMREYFVEDRSETYDSADITAHVPSYLLGDVISQSVSTTEEYSVVLTDDTTFDSVYLYQWKWRGSDKVQSAWGRWEFDVKPLAAEFVSNILYLLFQRADGVYLEQVDLLKRSDDGSDYITHLDRRVHPVSPSFDSNANQTTITVPYTDPSLTCVTDDGFNREVLSQHDNLDGTVTVVCHGSVTTSDWVGIVYEFSYTFTQPFLKQELNSSGVALPNYDGRLQIGTMSVRYENTGYFDVLVSPNPVDMYTSEFRGRILGSSNTVIGQLNLESGVFTFPVRARNEDMSVTITNNDFRPSAFLSAEWTGTFTPRSQRRV